MKKHLGNVDICGLQFQVFEVDAKGFPKIENNLGVCYPAAQEIYLETEQRGDLFMHTLIHEGLHGIWAHSGVESLRHDTDYEEQFIKTLTPHLMTFLRSIKGIRKKPTKLTEDRSNIGKHK